MEFDRNGLEVLDRATCLGLLEQSTLGRIAVTSGALPTILPINFRLFDDTILFRTGPGSKLASATNGAVVAFEVDDLDLVSHTGWSVVVTGIARTITEPKRLQALQSANVPRWVKSDDEGVVQISTEMISGRRLTPSRR